MKYVHIKTKAEFETESKILCPDWVLEDEYSVLSNNQDLGDEENLDNDFPDDDETYDYDESAEVSSDDDVTEGDDDLVEMIVEDSEAEKPKKTEPSNRTKKSGNKK